MYIVVAPWMLIIFVFVFRTKGIASLVIIMPPVQTIRMPRNTTMNG